MLPCFAWFPASFGKLGAALVAATGLNGTPFAFAPFEAGAVMLLGFIDEVEA